MAPMTATEILAEWPEESREAAEAVVKAYGEPDEATTSALTWNDAGKWKRVIAQRAFWAHDFPAPHNDSIETVVDYRVPVKMVGSLAEFDGSVMVERTTGEISARCHDEQANALALNLANDIVTGTKTVQEARAYYAKEFLDARKKNPTPYMEGLRFEPGSAAADPDERLLSDGDLAAAEGVGAARS